MTIAEFRHDLEQLVLPPPEPHECFRPYTLPDGTIIECCYKPSNAVIVSIKQTVLLPRPRGPHPDFGPSGGPYR